MKLLCKNTLNEELWSVTFRSRWIIGVLHWCRRATASQVSQNIWSTSLSVKPVCRRWFIRLTTWPPKSGAEQKKSHKQTALSLILEDEQPSTKEQPGLGWSPAEPGLKPGMVIPSLGFVFYCIKTVSSFYKAAQMWAALILSSRLTEELTISSCSSCLVVMSLLCISQGHGFKLPLSFAKNQIAQQTPGRGGRQFYSLHLRNSLVSLAFSTCCLICRNVTPTLNLQDWKTDDRVEKLIQIDPWMRLWPHR